MKPFLTVVMPVHCGEQWIVPTLDSLADQAADDVEIVVVDGSPDRGTADIVMRYAPQLKIRLLPRQDLDNWRSKTNFAVGEASGDYVCWLHQDDLWLPGRLAEIRRWIAAAPEAVLHLAPTLIIDQAGRPLGTWRCPLHAEAPLEPQLVLERLLVQNFIAAPTPVFRRDAWLACGGLDLDLWYTADWDIWLKLANRGAVRYHDTATAAFRIHGNSLTMTGSRDPADFEAQMRIVLDRHKVRLVPERSVPVDRAARASIKINVALAAASAGGLGPLARAAGHLIALGPSGLRRYLRDSRIIDRGLPRLRARLSGAL